MSLTGCMKKAGTALRASDKTEIQAAARQFRKDGMSVDEAGLAAIKEQMQSVRAQLSEALKPKPAAAAEPQKAEAAPPEVVAPPAEPSAPKPVEAYSAKETTDQDRISHEAELTNLERDAIQDPDIPALGDASNVSTESAMKALGFTQEDIDDNTRKEAARGAAKNSPAETAAPAAGETKAVDGTGKEKASVTDSEGLTAEDRADIENMAGEGGGVYFARNPLKVESVQEEHDILRSGSLGLNLGDALDRGAWADAYHQAKDAAQRKELMSHLGDQLIEKFADSKIKVKNWVRNLTVDPQLKQRLEGDMYRSDTVRSQLEKDVKDQFTEPMMKAITKAAKASKISADLTKKTAGWWMSARYAAEANAQLITKDRVALRTAQATKDAAKIAQAQQDLADRISDVNGAIGAVKKRGVAGGRNNADAAETVRLAELKVDRAMLEAIAKPIYDMMAHKKAMDLKSGKVTQTAVNSWLNSPRYVPLTGDPRFDMESTDVFSSGGQVNQDSDKEMNGRKDSVADDGIDAAFSAVIKSINFSAMQDFKQSMNKTYEAAQAAGIDIGLTREAVTGIMRTGDDVIIYRDTQRRANGTEFTNAQAFKFKDKRIMEAIKKDNQESLNTLLKVLATPTRWYARLVTQFMPMFAPINLVRDVWERSELLRTRDLLDRNGNKVDVKKAARAAIADTINRDVWRASMGKALKTGGMTQARGDLEEMIRLGGSSTTGDYLARSSGDLEADIRGDSSKLGHMNRKVMHGVEAYNNMFEMIPSLAVYRSLKAQNMSPVDAAAATLDLMNFRKKGTMMPAIKALYVFAQPAATGGYNLAQYLNTRTGKIRFATQVTIATALYALLKGAWGDDDDEEVSNKLDNLSNFTVERSIPVKLGDYVLKLPVGFGPPQLAWMSGVTLNRVISGRYSVADGLGELAKGWAKNFAAVSPSDIEVGKRPVDFLAQTFIPTTLKPLLNIAQDITSLGGPLTPTFKDKAKLRIDQAKRTTPGFYTDVAKQLHETLGVDMYPDHVKALTDGYLIGPMQQIVMMTIDADAKKLRGEPGRVPLVGSIIDAINDRSLLNSAYYRVLSDMDRAHREFGSMSADKDKREQITPEMRSAEVAFMRFESAEKLAGVQRAALRKNTSLDDDARAERTQSIEDRVDKDHKRLLVQYFQSKE